MNDYINSNINNIKIDVLCCSLFCVKVVEGVNDGSDSQQSKTRIFLDVTQRKHAFLDSDALSQANIQCLINKASEATDINNTSTTKPNSADLLKLCNIETSISTFPIKSSCLGYLMDQLKASNKLKVINQFSVFIPGDATNNSDKICETPKECISIGKGKFSSALQKEKLSCGKAVANMYIKNGNIDYEGLLTPCNKNTMTSSASDIAQQDIEGESRLRNLGRNEKQKNILFGVELTNIAGKNFKRKLTTQNNAYIEDLKINESQQDEINLVEQVFITSQSNALIEGMNFRIDSSTTDQTSQLADTEFTQINNFGESLVNGTNEIAVATPQNSALSQIAPVNAADQQLGLVWDPNTQAYIYAARNFIKSSLGLLIINFLLNII